MAALKSYKPLRRKKWLTAKTRLKRTTANPAKKLAAKSAKRSAKSWQRGCDDKFSLIVRTAAGCCQMCGKTRTLQTHHLIGRAGMWYRYDPKNVLCLCTSCHMEAEQNPALFLEKFTEQHPERAAWLEIHCHKVHAQSWRAEYYPLVDAWLKAIAEAESLDSLWNLPTWQQVNGLEVDDA